jgi:LysM repeat protein
MQENSFNLVDLVRGNFTDTFINRLSLFLGETREKTQTGLHAAAPTLLGELDNAASTPDGSRRLASAIDDADDTLLDNFSGIFGKEWPADAHMGTLRSILGIGALSELMGNLGRTSGLSSKSITALLGILTPVILGTFRRVLRQRGLRSADVASLLSSQRPNISAATPVGMGHGFTEETYATSREAARRRNAFAEEPPRSERPSGGWILPLVALAGALGLIWYLASRSTTPTTREATNITERSKASQTPVPAYDLKTKYHSVIEEARAQGVQLSSVYQENGKLVLRGTAPSLEAADKVRDEIRRVNPSMNEVIADFSVASSQAPATVPDKSVRLPDDTSRAKPSAAEKPADGVDQMYTVQRGDTLGSISNHFYGNTKDYNRIFEANKDRIKDPNMIHVGEKLMIP